MRKLTDGKLLTGVFICAGFAAIFTGAFIFFLHLHAASQETRVEASDTFKLSTVSGIEDKSDIVLCAHRGLSAVAPENTAAAILAAGEAGFAYVEFDVQETRDGMLVLMHDSKINRMTNGRGRVRAYTLKELLGFDIDNGANIKKYADAKIPTLGQALAACESCGVTPVVEMKSVSDDGVRMLADTLSGRVFEKKPVVISFDSGKLTAFGEINKDAERWLLSAKLDDGDIEYCLDNPGILLSFDASRAKAEDGGAAVREIAEKGIGLGCWTVNDPDTLRYFYNCAIRLFTTDCILPLRQED